MKIGLAQKLKDGIWRVLAMVVGWTFIILLDISITFLTVFIVTLLGFIIGDMIGVIVRHRWNDTGDG